MTPQQFTVDYFIQKFEAIPEHLWATRSYTVLRYTGEIQHCALGHCGQRSGLTTPESLALTAIFGGAGLSVIEINDTEDGNTSPKERILHALYAIKSA